jgi:hypothetical protein
MDFVVDGSHTNTNDAANPGGAIKVCKFGRESRSV